MDLCIPNFFASIGGKGFSHTFQSGANVVRLSIFKNKKENDPTFEVSVLEGVNPFSKWMIHNKSNPRSVPYSFIGLRNTVQRSKIEQLLVGNALHIFPVIDGEPASKIVSSLFNNPEYSDVTVEVGSKVLHLHKFILFKHSNVFKTMLTSGMSESVTNKIVITEFPAVVVTACFRMMYESFHDIGSASKAFNLELFRMASMYGIRTLVARCEQDWLRSITAENCLERLQWAHSCDCTLLKYACMDYLRSNMSEQLDTDKIVDMFGVVDGYDLIESVCCN